jgi:hypothetical protein
LKVLADALVDSSAPFVPTELELALLKDLLSLGGIEPLVPAPTPAHSLDADPPPSSGNFNVVQQSDFGIWHRLFFPRRSNTGNGQSSRILAGITALRPRYRESWGRSYWG